MPRPFLLIVTLWAVLSFAADAQAAQPISRFGIFVYSQLCYSAQSGDVDGFRIVLLRLPEGDSVFFEEADGAIMEPLIGNAMIDPKTSEISFEIRVPNIPSDDPIRFRGTIDSDNLTGTLLWRGGAGGTHDLQLPRRLFLTGELGEECHR